MGPLQVYLLTGQWFVNDLKKVAMNQFICLCSTCPSSTGKLQSGTDPKGFAAAARIIYECGLDGFKKYVHVTALQGDSGLQNTQNTQNAQTA
jgi:hypothetical protein